MTKITIPPEAFVVNHVFEDSEFFMEEAKKFQGKDPHVTRRYVRASIITAFAALEAFLNTMLYLLDEGADLDLSERAFIQEKRVELTEDGYFDMKGSGIHRSKRRSGSCIGTEKAPASRRVTLPGSHLLMRKGCETRFSLIPNLPLLPTPR